MINNNQTINPHMKLKPQVKGVVQPPLVYSYSLSEELKLGEQEYKQMIKKLNKKQMATFRENHPNLKTNILSIIGVALGIIGICCGYRYRHSIPILKSICKPPEKTPPEFIKEFSKIWTTIVKKFKK